MTGGRLVSEGSKLLPHITCSSLIERVKELRGAELG